MRGICGQGPVQQNLDIVGGEAGAGETRCWSGSKGVCPLLISTMSDAGSDFELESGKEDDNSPYDDDDDQTGAVTDKRERKTARKQGLLEQWDIICDNVDEEEINSRLKSTAKLELGGSASWSPAAWKPKVGYNKLGVRRRIYRCAFRGHANSSCNAQVRVTVDVDGKWMLERKRLAHTDHRISNKKRGAPKLLKVAATSPSKQGLAPARVIARVRAEHGGISKEERAQLVCALQKEKKKQKNLSVPSDLRRTFGGVAHWAANHSREVLEKKNEFGIHTVYVCGTPQIDSSQNLVNIAYSTENLLLNAYRQEQHGIPSLVQIDCTHRLVLEGHACMLFGTVDTAQHFHTVWMHICLLSSTYTFLWLGLTVTICQFRLGMDSAPRKMTTPISTCFVASNMRSSPLLLNVFATNKKFEV